MSIKRILTVGAALLAATTALAQTAQTKVRISWDAPLSEEAIQKHVVEYQTKGATNWVAVDVPSPAVTVVLDVTPWGTRFRVKAANQWGESPYSDVAILPSKMTFTISVP